MSKLIERKIKYGRLLCESVTKDMSTHQKRIVEGVYNEFIPLFEMDLGNDKLKELFNDIEQKLTDAGENRTKLGSAKDAISKANEIINKAGKWLQDSTPVKMFDDKFEELKKKITEKLGEDSKTINLITKMGYYAKEHPKKTAFVIGVMTALASLSGGPVAGAIVAHLSKGIIELMKGEKLSTAIGKGFKSAVLGYITGSVLQHIGDWVSGIQLKTIDFSNDITKITFSGSQTVDHPGFEWTRSFERIDMAVLKSDQKYIEDLIKAVNNGKPEAFDKLYRMADFITSSDYKNELSAYKDLIIDNNKAHKVIVAAKNALSALAQGAASGIASSEKKEEKEKTSESALTIYQLKNLFEYCEDNVLKENRLKTFAKNITTKYTADKIYKAWIKSQKPRDHEDVMNFLKGLGINEKIIRAAYKDLNINQPKKKQQSQPKSQDEITDKFKDMNKDDLEKLLALVDNKMKSMKAAKTKNAEKKKVV